MRRRYMPNETAMAELILKPGREKSLLRRHPWVFSGALAKINGSPALGETIDIITAKGRWLARGAYSPRSQIAARIWSFDQGQAVDAAFFSHRLKRAEAYRRRWRPFSGGGAERLVHAESDGLPGLIVDRYADYLVCQFLSAGAEVWKRVIVEQLAARMPCRGILERSDTDSRLKEGLSKATGLLCGAAPPELIEIKEEALRFLIDPYKGHKTGFYLDQRDNRRRIGALSQGARVLNGFSYSGGFGIYALKAGAASVVNIDASAQALALSRRNLAANQLDESRVVHLKADVFSALRRFCEQGRRFELIVLDPPKFVESRAHLIKASRGYKDINRLAFELLAPGGVLGTFSCSGLLPPDLFQKIVADAAVDAGRFARIATRLEASADHPVALNFPEGRYLKGLVVQVET
jgi:23S rRNA (cytosine1962-C5)-methyltransferase